MKHIFLLSGDYVDLGKEEAISLFNVKKFDLFDRLLIADSKDYNESLFNKTTQRLALTKNIYKFLFECKVNDLIKRMENFDWNSVYEGDFCLRVNNLNDDNPITKKFINEKHNKKIKNKINETTSLSKSVGSNPFVMHSEKELAGYIWRSLSNPKVNLENPKTLIEIFIINKKAYCGLLIFKNNENFEPRKSHLRPFPHPSSLHPKLARALVNISGIQGNEILLDPFCGTGGFLTESGLMNIKTIGYDINKIMIKGCKENLEHFKIKNSIIKNKNAIDISDKFDYVVTDLPYGLNSNVMAMYEKDWKKHRINKKIDRKNFEAKLENFYLKFLKNLRKKLKKKAVIVFPSYVDYRKLLKKSKFRIEFKYEDYVHRSLRREIVKIS